MGFFSDLKEDLSQAVNELLPEDELSRPGNQENSSTVSLDEMLKNIDEFQLPEDALEEASAEETEAELPTAESTDGQESDDADIEKMLEKMLEEEMETKDSVDEPEIDTATEEIPQTVDKKTSSEKNADKGVDNKMESAKVAIDETAIITGGMTITGDIVSQGSIDVVGTVNGNIDILGKLNITGHINGNSKAAEIYAESAKINGEVVSEGAVKVGASSVIIGNITATSAAIAGAVKGDIDVKGPVVLDASAIVMGNIKSKSVQINNGAVIEGMCSQCYADVSPTSFFDDYKA